jgi:hypothetical protein
MEAWQHLQPVIDRIIPIAFDRSLDALTPAERNVFLIWSYPAAINNGGHDSFFYNCNGEHAHETVQALNDIGSSDFAQILSRAIDLFPSRYIPRDIEERNDAHQALPESASKVMEQLDQEFYVLDGEDVLLSRLLRYWNDHA